MLCNHLIDLASELPKILLLARQQVACVEHKKKFVYPTICAVVLLVLGGAWYMLPGSSGWNMWVAIWFWFETFSTGKAAVFCVVM